MVDFVRLSKTAQRLISENGRKVTFRKLGREVSNPSTPWRGNASPRDPLQTSVEATAVFVSPSSASSLGLSERLEELTSRLDQIAIVSLGPDATEDLKTFHEISDAGLQWKIEFVEELRPANTTVLYYVGVSR